MDLALFDFDGTLAEGESFGAFLREVVPSHHRRRIGWRVAPLVLGYRLRLLSGTTARARITRLALAGMRLADLEVAARRFATGALPRSLKPAALARLDWHRARGDDIVIVSGAKREYLQHWCDRQGLRLLASSLEVEADALTGRYAGAQCVGAEKARRIRAELDLTRYARVHAYGDTDEDAAMLALADHPHLRCMPPPGVVACGCRTQRLSASRG